MKKILFVLRTEIANTVLRPSFFILTFGLPVIGFILISVFTNASEESQATITSLIAPSPLVETQGYIDPAGIIQRLPSDITPEMLREYPDEASALAAVESGEIISYYLIPENVAVDGEITLIQPEFNPVSSESSSWMMEWTLIVNLVGGDELLASQINMPMIETRVSLEPGKVTDEENPLAFAVPYAVTMFFYIIIFGSASTLLNSISKEKQNRVIEMLLLSTTPTQLITGKLIGLGLIGLLQTAVYTGVGSALLKMSGRSFEAAAMFEIPPSMIRWGLLFFIFGYTLYAALMAGAGALAPNTREASQITFVLIIPLIVPLFFINNLIREPNSTLSLVISLFPFSAPVAMMTRLTTNVVIPLWQPLAALALTGLTAYGVILLVSRLFRAQTLLSGQEFNTKVFFKALFGRA